MGTTADFRHRALASVDALIVEAERLCSDRHQTLEKLTAAGENTRRAATLLNVAKAHLEQLRTSRSYLVTADPSDGIKPRRRSAGPRQKTAG